ncbi:MAG: hypothetical protein L6R37_002431 [Teloschistes peruensis]|nr:MAG: hypothetical protein L6R37_002431 [Teloschistes peruensis]
MFRQSHAFPTVASTVRSASSTSTEDKVTETAQRLGNNPLSKLKHLLITKACCHAALKPALPLPKSRLKSEISEAVTLLASPIIGFQDGGRTPKAQAPGLKFAKSPGDPSLRADKVPLHTNWAHVSGADTMLVKMTIGNRGTRPDILRRAETQQLLYIETSTSLDPNGFHLATELDQGPQSRAADATELKGQARCPVVEAYKD